MTEKSVVNPQAAGKSEYSPLDISIKSCLRRFGDFSSGSVNGDVAMMFIEFANRVIEDLRLHPYYDGSPIDYYTSQTDTRPIPDLIVIDGLVAHYALQRGSKKMDYLNQMYYRTMNQVLYQRKYGNLPIASMQTDFEPLPSDIEGNVLQVELAEDSS